MSVRSSWGLWDGVPAAEEISYSAPFDSLIDFTDEEQQDVDRRAQTLRTELMEVNQDDESIQGVLPHEELAKVIPIEEPGTDVISRTRRAVALSLAVQWTAANSETTVDFVLRTAEQFRKYIEAGITPGPDKEE